MDYSRHGRCVNESMQGLPALSAQLADRPLRRSERQREHQPEGRQSSRNETAFPDVVKHFMYIEEFVQPNVSHQVQRSIKKREQPEHPSQSNQPILPCDLSKRTDR